MISSEAREEKALKVAEEIATLRARIAALTEEFRGLVGGPSNAGTKTASAAPGGNATQESAASRILAVFTRQPGKKVAMQSVVTELRDISPVLIRSTITRFARGGKKLKKVSRGAYKSVVILNGDTEAKP